MRKTHKLLDKLIMPWAHLRKKLRLRIRGMTISRAILTFCIFLLDFCGVISYCQTNVRFSGMNKNGLAGYRKVPENPVRKSKSEKQGS
jgi:hypothetical protein